MEKYLELIELYKNDEKNIGKSFSKIATMYITIIVIFTTCICLFIKNEYIEIITLPILILFVFFTFSNLFEKNVYKIIKKFNKKIKTEDILGVYKYGNYRISSNWNIIERIVDNYILLNNQYIPNEKEYLLELDFDLEVKISKELYKHLQEANKQKAFLILTEDEFQNILKNKSCNDYIII